MPRTKYTDAEKKAICADLALYGDEQQVADMHGCAPSTLKTWKKQGWFNDLLLTLQTEQSQRLVAKANRAMDQALTELADRLERGDVRIHMVKGEAHQYREPIKARDLSAIINVLATRSEKAAALAGQSQTNYQLADLQSSFRQFAKSYKVANHNVIDIEPEQTTEQDNHTSLPSQRVNGG